MSHSASSNHFDQYDSALPGAERKQSEKSNYWLHSVEDEKKPTEKSTTEVFKEYEQALKDNKDLSGESELQRIITHISKLNESKNEAELNNYIYFMRTIVAITKLKPRTTVYQNVINFFKHGRSHDDSIVGKLNERFALVEPEDDRFYFLDYFTSESFPIHGMRSFSDLVEKVALCKRNEEAHLNAIFRLGQSEEGYRFIRELTPNELSLLPTQIIESIYCLADRRESEISKCAHLRNLFIYILKSDLVKNNNQDLLRKLYKLICDFIRSKEILFDGRKYYFVDDKLLYAFFKKQEKALISIVNSHYTQEQYHDLLKAHFKAVHYGYQAYIAWKSFERDQTDIFDIIDRSQYLEARNKPVLSPLLMEIKKKICEQVNSEINTIFKSNSLAYQGIASSAIFSAALAFENPTPENVKQMIEFAGQLSDSRSYFAAWALIGAGLLVMLLGYAASANTLGISAYIGQQCGMNLISAGAAGLAAGGAMKAFQFFGPSLEKSLEKSGPELIKHYHGQKIAASLK